VIYRYFCNQASVVSVTSTWMKNDLVKQYRLSPDKIAVVPLAPVLDFYPEPTAVDLQRTRVALSLPESFAFYPAQTWPHKNHLGILKALKSIRDRHQRDIHFVFSGLKDVFYYGEIEPYVRKHGLQHIVHFVGFVSPLEIRVLYRLAKCVIVASKFEAASFPLWEAFQAGTAAGTSNVTSLPAQAADAARLFDPNDEQQIAAVLLRLWDDDDLRATLIARGRTVVARFRWRNTALGFRALYRRLSGQPLDESDAAILSAPPIL
jgi:glycosyltransferase involved in cell wall biosynthesis